MFDTPHGKIGVVVCFDRHYPESIRTEALMGADLILIPTANTESEPMEMFDWEIKVQAFQNSVAVLWPFAGDGRQRRHHRPGWQRRGAAVRRGGHGRFRPYPCRAALYRSAADGVVPVMSVI